MFLSMAGIRLLIYSDIHDVGVWMSCVLKFEIIDNVGCLLVKIKIKNNHFFLSGEFIEYMRCVFQSCMLFIFHTCFFNSIHVKKSLVYYDSSLRNNLALIYKWLVMTYLALVNWISFWELYCCCSWLFIVACVWLLLVTVWQSLTCFLVNFFFSLNMSYIYMHTIKYIYPC